MTSPLRLRRDYGEDRVATESFNDEFMSLFSNPPSSISLPWGTPPKPNIWKAKIKTSGIKFDQKVLYTVESPVLSKGDMVLELLRSPSNGVKIKLSDNGVVIYSHTIEPMGLYPVSKALKLFWAYLADSKSVKAREFFSSYLKDNIRVAVSKVASKANPVAFLKAVKEVVSSIRHLGLKINYDEWGSDRSPDNIFLSFKVSVVGVANLSLDFQWSAQAQTAQVTEGKKTLFTAHTLEDFPLILNLMPTTTKTSKFASSNQMFPHLFSLTNVDNDLLMKAISCVSSAPQKPMSRRELAIKLSDALGDLEVKGSLSLVDVVLKDLNDLKKEYLVKVASIEAHDVPALEYLGTNPSSLSLPWGNPAKPNIWKVKHQGGSRFVVASPVLSTDYSYILLFSKAHSVIEFIAFDKDGKANEIHRKQWHNSAWAKQSLHDILDHFWFSMWKEPLIKKYLKVDKVASNLQHSSVMDVIRQKPDTFVLHWGDPPKPNVWRVSLSHKSITQLKYSIVSPLINDVTSSSLELIFDDINKDKINVELWSPRLSRCFYSTTRSISELEYWTPTEFTSYIWRRVTKNLKRNDDWELVFKPNVKVASALSHVRSKQTYGLRSLSNPSSQTGLFFYPVRQHRSKRATRHAFYLNDTELNIMEWQGSEWSRMSSVTLRRQQSELLLRLLRTIANTVEKM